MLGPGKFQGPVQDGQGFLSEKKEREEVAMGYQRRRGLY